MTVDAQVYTTIHCCVDCRVHNAGSVTALIEHQKLIVDHQLVPLIESMDLVNVTVWAGRGVSQNTLEFAEVDGFHSAVEVDVPFTDESVDSRTVCS